MLVGRRRRPRLRLGDLGAQPLELGLELRPVAKLGLGPLASQLLLFEPLLQLLRSAPPSPPATVPASAACAGRTSARLVASSSAVRAGEPVAELEQMRYRRHRVVLAQRPCVMGGPVAEPDHLPGHLEHRVAEQRLERRLVQQRAHALVVRPRQRPVVGERPLDRLLRRPPGVEARRPRITQRRRSRRTAPRCRSGKSARRTRTAWCHNSPRKARCWSARATGSPNRRCPSRIVSPDRATWPTAGRNRACTSAGGRGRSRP